MADQSSRGGQKAGQEHDAQGKAHRHTHPGGKEDRSETHKQEDALRGRQGSDGGYTGQHGSNEDRDNG